jgi:hypothetical protein
MISFIHNAKMYVVTLDMLEYVVICTWT